VAIAMSETEYISSKELKELHGFTDSSIKRFLGECDMTQSNPKSKSAAPIRMYSIERVNAVLADQAFIAGQSKKQASTSKQKQAVVNIEVVPKTEAIDNRQAPRIEAFDFDGGLSDLKTSDWDDFQWEHFRDDGNKLSEEQKLHAVITVKKMLATAYWFTPEDFFNAFSQYGKGGVDSPDLVSTYKSSILTNGWMGIPLVSLMICDRKSSTKMMLDAGHHRWNALKELWEAKELPTDFKIPVFDLKRLRLIVRDQYNPSLEFALRYAVTGGTLGHDFALRVIAKNWFTRLCTGVDCSY
jgi:hypothetical protein